MGARLINNSRRTKIGHVEDFPVLDMRSLRKTAMFSEGQRTEGHFRCPGASNAITIIVDLRSEHNLEVLLEVGHTDSATNMQVIGLTHRPTGGGGLIWAALPPRPDAQAALVRQRINAAGGHAMLLRAPEEIRRNVEVFHPQPGGLAALSERVRHSFDPKNILNRGRMTRESAT